MITRGKKVSQCTPSYKEIRAGAPVNESLEALRQQASATMGRDIPQEVYTLARVARSERAPFGPNLESLIIIFCALNVYKKSGNWDHIIGTDGAFGRQLGSAWFSTSADPYESDILLAEQAYNGLVENPVGSATNFMHPKGFSDVAEWERKRDAWLAKGLEMITYPGAPGIVVFA